jgi:formylglycine-generating enzyme required for sulfatase activity
MTTARPLDSIDCSTRDFDYVACLKDDPDGTRLAQLRTKLRAQLDGRLYEREGTRWYQTAFAEYYAFIFDVTFYDRNTNRYRIEELIAEGRARFGGFDMLILWQSYPRLGVDERNQFDLYREMPGGLEGLRDMVARAHALGVKVLLNYNPWDNGTRPEPQGHGTALGDVMNTIGADGVFLDTMATFDKAESGFKAAVEAKNADAVYDPEAMVGPDGTGIISGSWQQTMSLEPPSMIAVRWLEPRFSMRGIRRESEDRRWHIHSNFFAGCGQVVWENVFGWWNPWRDREAALLSRCLRILRRFKDAFIDRDWQPYVPTLVASVFAHRWQGNGVTVYTLLNAAQEAVEGELLAVPHRDGVGYVNAWTGERVACETRDKRDVLKLRLEARHSGCVIVTKDPEALCAELRAGQTPRAVTVEEAVERPDYLGLVSPQKIDEFEIEHARRTTVEGHLPRPVAPTARVAARSPEPSMVLVPGERFVMRVRHSEDVAMAGACYGEQGGHRSMTHPDFGPGFKVQTGDHPEQFHWMEPFHIDRTEVTNAMFSEFVRAEQYRPGDLTNLLRHWDRPAGSQERPWEWRCPAQLASHPVVWVDLEDARAYARWAGKRLPTEPEWQYAAQYTSDGLHNRTWPWGMAFDHRHCNTDSPGTTPVDAFASGASSLGILDLAGNVWEWTESERHDGHTRYAILRGGCYFRAKGSIWYRAGGAQPNDVHTKFLFMYPGLDRCGTVGFRCVKDVA